MRRTWLSMLAVAMLLGAAVPALAQETKPVMVVSFSGYNELIADVDMIGKLGGAPELSKGLEGLLAVATAGKGVAGLDKTKPLGAVVYTDGDSFPAVGFVPVTDLKALLGVLEGPLGEAKDDGTGIYELSGGDTTWFITQKAGWAFVAREKEHLGKAPADLLKVLGGLEKQYDLAVKVTVKNLPEQIRGMITGGLQMGAQAALERQPGESDEQYALRSKLAQQSMEQMLRAIKELDTVLVGFSIDRESKKAFLDLTITAIEGSETAKEMAEAGDLKTEFAGFVMPEAAFTTRMTSAMSASDIAQTKSMMASFRSSIVKNLANQGLTEDQEKKAEKLIGDFFDVIDKTIDSKKMDAGMAVLLKPGAATLVAGAYVADGAKIEGMAKEIVAVAKQEQPEVAGMIKLNAETHEGVNLHVATVPLPVDSGDEGAKRMAQLVGDKLEVALGTGPKAVYFAAGRDALKTLKDAISKSKTDAGKEVVPVQISVSVGAIAKFAAETSDDPQAKQVAGMIGGMLAQSAGKDHVTITSKTVPNGATARIELEEGVLSALGGAVRMGMMMGAGGGARPGIPGDF